MFDKIGFNDKDLLQKIIAISKISESDDRELALEELSNNYRDNKYIYFQKARNAEHQELYKVAKRAYEAVLNCDPRFVLALNNLGLLLENHFSDYEGARECYEKAIKINHPRYAEPDSNLGHLLIVHFEEFDLAKIHLEKAIEIDPEHEGAMINLAGLLCTHFSEFEGAREYYEKVIEINPDNTFVLYCYAIFLLQYFEDYSNATKLYQRVIKIDEKSRFVSELAVLLKEYL